MAYREHSTTGTSGATGDDKAGSSATASTTSDSELEQLRTGSTVSSLINRLKRPTVSDLSRKRKVQTNPPRGTKRGKGAVAAEPSVSPSDRIREFPDEQLSTVLGKLFCNACRENVSVKKSIIIQHIKSVKHATGKARLALKEKKERDIADMLLKYDKTVHPVGESLSDQGAGAQGGHVQQCLLHCNALLGAVLSFRVEYAHHSRMQKDWVPD